MSKRSRGWGLIIHSAVSPTSHGNDVISEDSVYMVNHSNRKSYLQRIVSVSKHPKRCEGSQRADHTERCAQLCVWRLCANMGGVANANPIKSWWWAKKKGTCLNSWMNPWTWEDSWRATYLAVEHILWGSFFCTSYSTRGLPRQAHEEPPHCYYRKPQVILDTAHKKQEGKKSMNHKNYFMFLTVYQVVLKILHSYTYQDASLILN